MNLKNKTFEWCIAMLYYVLGLSFVICGFFDMYPTKMGVWSPMSFLGIIFVVIGDNYILSDKIKHIKKSAFIKNE
jgi:hypothetical protein